MVILGLFFRWTEWQELQVQGDQELLVDLEVQVVLEDHLFQVGLLVHLNHLGQENHYRVDLLLQEGFQILQKEHFL